jgi:lipoprotein NlpD
VIRLYPPGASGGADHGGDRAASAAAPAALRRPRHRRPVKSNIAWRWPADGAIVGRYVAGDATKQGVDIAGTSGQAVKATANGVVVYSGAGWSATAS